MARRLSVFALGFLAALAISYLVDNQTVAKTNGTNTRSAAGVVRGVDAEGVWVQF